MNEGKTTCGNPSRGRYVQGCRCYMCRVANADYSREQANRKKGSQSTPMVGRHAVAKARNRVRGWIDDGHSLREICRATGVNRNAMRTLMTGKHPNAAHFKDGKPKMPKRMSRRNYDAIMRCDDPSSPKGGQRIDASSLNNALAWLYAHGVTPYRVSKVSGIPVGTIYGLGDRRECNATTLARLASAAERLKEEAER